MSTTRIRITGPQQAEYMLGQAMFLYEGQALLGQLDPVIVMNSGTGVHIEAFAPTRLVLDERRHVGRLLFFEICAYITEHFPQIQAVSFAFARPIGVFGRPMELAVSRAQAMERIGAVNVQITPHRSGKHVVSGIWPYSQANLAALKVALEEQRALYVKRPIVAKPDEPTLVGAIRRLVSMRKRE